MTRIVASDVVSLTHCPRRFWYEYNPPAGMEEVESDPFDALIIRRKLRILEHAEAVRDVSRTCRNFGIGRANFYRWRHAYQTHGDAGLTNRRSVPHNHPNKTPPEIAEKLLHLRRKYHLGPIRIVWYLERYHGSGSRMQGSIASSNATA